MKAKAMWKVCSKFVVDNLPTILSVTAVVGLCWSVASAIIDTPKAKEKIIETKMNKAEELERNDPKAFEEGGLSMYRDEDGILSLNKIKLTPWEYTKILVPIYWKTGVCMALTGTCIFAANHVNKKRFLAAIAALSLKDKQLKELEEKAKEFFGENKFHEFERETAKEETYSVNELNQPYVTSKGNQIFYEPLYNTLFRASVNSVKQDWFNIKNQLLLDNSATVSDWYYNLDVPIMDTYIPDRMIWEYEPGDLKKTIPKIDFIYGGVYEATGEAVIKIDYSRRPDLG